MDDQLLKHDQGYKMCKQISKAIAWHSSTVQKDLDKYNVLAPLQKPPRPHLEYSEITSYVWVGEFALLKHSRHEIYQKPWAVPSNREVAMKYLKIVRAREEITCLNVEIGRLQAWVDDEDRQLSDVATSLLGTEPCCRDQTSRHPTSLHQQLALQTARSHLHTGQIHGPHSEQGGGCI
jgi:hypothetical protein